MKEKIWGGDKILGIFGNKSDRVSDIGEAWLLTAFGQDYSQDEENHSIVDFLEKRLKRTDYPLLYKFIDAESNLSVQVHPEDKILGNKFISGKTECWYIMEAEPNASVIAGFKKPVTPDEIKSAVNSGMLSDLLNFIPVKKNDLIFIPAGTVHAILKGVVLFELQQASDTTYRLFDWNRVDKNGNSRELRLKESLEHLNMVASSDYKIKPVERKAKAGVKWYVRVVSPKFVLEEIIWSKKTDFIRSVKEDSFVLTVLNGTLRVGNSEKEVVLLSGETALFSCAEEEFVFNGSKGCKLLFSYVPDLTRDVLEALLREGISREEIISLCGSDPRVIATVDKI